MKAPTLPGVKPQTALLVAATALFLAAAVSVQARPAEGQPREREARPQESQDAGKDLPDGAGKLILQRACTTCHGLGEVTKFKGFYVRSQWYDTVVTMAAYGAEISTEEIDVLADYLTLHLGKKE